MGDYQISEEQLPQPSDEKMEENLGDEFQNIENEKRQKKKRF
jgi:hypothetical protein